MLTGKALVEDIDACRVGPGQAGYWWLGQHSFVVKLGKTVLYIDPFLTPMEARRVPPLLTAAELTDAAAILGSHDHADHIDRDAWPALAGSSDAPFIVPMLLREKIIGELGLPAARVLGIDEGVTLNIGEATITAIPAAHEFLDTDPATGRHPFLGFIIQGNGFTVYHAGDTCIYEGIQAKLRQWKIDLAFLPINGRDAQRLKANCIGNMTYQEAVDLAGSQQFGMTVPAHFEMFAMNSENPQRFIDYMQVKYPKLKGRIPVHGERTVVNAGGRN
ncbi:MAG TPA: MBL fold metallo-hydrolase [Tepidisphaeraceae bacterium]|jgi:L-ascorbate metabolism protein UlaG (beta-lactamase superfamily)|nr:MBL fold metallo-hydrolase [Tepidisphaeraceae bacterium]